MQNTESSVSYTLYTTHQLHSIAATRVLLTTREAAWCIILVVSVCMSVCLSYDNFPKSGCEKFIFAHAVYLQGVRVEFVYEGHRVKVKVTRAKIPIPAM